ncbi:TPA: type II toxin-antitoxin system VapC family toxin [Candidatus Woesearchaeota archaeon]|nr:PIN domain-containing protein [Candidatus Woesearchaeota archaeon]HIG93646.1 type II toxin-antitoxin system VapC family toxin [Candidatus Woesearchaeota archaeon]HIH12734.1 type II toxin-antitoxin system VapC family toxin [Candidatus Woesearchaeota archaeon]
MAVFDTFALVKFLKKEAGWEKVDKALQEGGYISDATLYELLYVCARDFLDQGYNLHESTRKAREIVTSFMVHLKGQFLSDQVRSEAVYFKIKYNRLNLSHFDCLALATAKTLNEPLFSGEKGLAQTKEVRVLG